ncbi:putative cytochrome P450 E-class, group I [Podospora fimiseda]|uniref:Cytochrome P450 E-class, group I n=1 Tax=Podospora fimiseda TaxID=252190 RepID=A0AAN7BK53_9PEZI|nr:putative cytochrome P450 E-class, group I [Podospora fimiseda]
MALPYTLIILVSIALVAVNRYLSRKRLPPGSKHLPGPRNIPFIGRVHDVPEKASWVKFYEWSKVYGPIYKQEIFGKVHVWISSEKIAHELLAKKASIYSDRPQIPNLPDNRTSGDYLALLGSTETWKRQRKLCNHLMHSSALASLHQYPTRERNRFLYLMAKDPENYIEWIEQFTSRTVARLSWGTAKPAQILRHTTFGLLQTISPTGALPNILAFLRHVPGVISPWKKKENARHELEDRLFKANVEFARQGVHNGKGEESFITTFLRSQISDDERERTKWGEKEEAMHVVGLMAIAGTLTIGSPIQSYILAMCHYPEAQKALQKEIDEACEGKCPQWEDREKLPMLRAVVKEVIRWRPPVPTGIPHATEKDDVYNGYFIPKGATIHALEWGITRDEEVYPNAEEFMPTRWLDPQYPTYREPLTQYPNLSGFSQFGFGRRTCQGVPIVEQDLFLTIGGMAWAFNIQKKINPSTGKEIPIHWNDYTSLLIAKPLRFAFDAIPRHEDKIAEMRAMFDSAREVEQDQNDSFEMDLSAFEKDLGVEKVYGDTAVELNRIKEDAREEERQKQRKREDSGSERGGYSSSEPGLEFRDSSSEADTESTEEGSVEAAVPAIVDLDGSLIKNGLGRRVAAVLEVPGAWKWA